MDEEIATFMMVTDVKSDHVARGYLQIAGGNAGQAIQMFFDQPELQSSFDSPTSAPTASATTSSRPQPSTSRARTGREDASGVIHLDSDDDNDDFDVNMSDNPMEIDDDDDVVAIARNAQEEEDAAMARKLQEELYGSGSGAAEDGVRAPIAQTTETLAAPSMPWGIADDDNGRGDDALAQLRARQFHRQRNVNPSNPFSQAPSIWDDASVRPTPVEPEQATGRAALLRDLFRPPHELISNATWDEAREEGKEQKKWIIVNLQDLDIFHCQVLNRDVWKDANLQALIREHFIFLQYEKREPRAQSYIQFYFPNESHENSDNYPHVSIIDPRTGEQVKVWSGLPFPKVGELYGDLIEFLDRYSLAANSKNPVVKAKPKRQQVDVGRLTEDEMLQLAMQNSLENQDVSTGSSVQDPDMLTKYNDETGKGKGRATDAMDLTGSSAQPSTAEPANAAESAFSQISSSNPHVEPANDPATTTRIQFRHSAGRIIRRFAVSDPVSRIYEWLKAEPFEEGKQGVMFELKAMPAGMDLISELDKTLGEAGLKQGTVMIEFIEE